MAAAAALSEARRLEALRRLDVLDTPAEGALDEIVRSAAEATSAPMAALSLVDEHRQFFKARCGLTPTETPRPGSFCSYAIEQSGLFVVRDALQDARFQHHPLVVGPPGIRFYAAAPLVVGRGATIGTLCVMDSQPRRRFSAAEGKALQSLSRRASALLEERRRNAVRARAQRGLASALRDALQALALDARALVKETGRSKKAARMLLSAELAAQLVEELAGPTGVASQELLRPREADLVPVIAQLAEALEGMVPGRRVVVSANGDCRGTWDVDVLTGALGRLFEEALTLASSSVRVDVRGVPDGVEMSLKATGVASLEGLGATLLEDVSLSHGGEFALHDVPDGISATVWLPRRARR